LQYKPNTPLLTRRYLSPSHFPTFLLSYSFSFTCSPVFLFSRSAAFSLSHLPTFSLSYLPTFSLSHLLTSSLSHFSHLFLFSRSAATATCCRKCLEKWHGIPKDRDLTSREIDYVVSVITRWLKENSDISIHDPHL